MPNYETEAKKDLEQQIKALEQSGFSKLGIAYELYVGKLKALNKATQEQYRKDSFGLDKDLTPEKLNEFKTLYSECGAMGERFLEYAKADKNNPAVGIVRKINNILSDDFKVLNGVDEKTLQNETVSLQQIIDRSRIRTVDLGSKRIDAVGEMSSSRIPFNLVEADGHEMPGVFTAKKTMDMGADYSKMLGEVKADSPKLAPLIEAYAAAFEKLDPKASASTDGERKYKAMWALKSSANISSTLSKFAPEAYNQYISGVDNATVQKDLNALAPKLNGFFQAHAMNYLAANITDKSRIDSRNSAMSTVADMLHVPNLICRSVPMKVVIDGQEVEGTFMAMAQGVDILRPPKEVLSPEYGKGGPVFSNTNGLKDVADLQILDFICGNVDRHAANMFYKFDNSDSDPSRHKFTGVQGIDNDCAFGSYIPKDEKTRSNARLCSLNDMKVISRSMANSVLSMDKEMLTFALRNHGLSKEQLDSAGKRLDMLKNYVMKSIGAYNNLNKNQVNYLNQNPEYVIPGTIRVVNDNDFNKLNIQKLTAKDGNSFSMVYNFHSVVSNKVKKNEVKEAISPEKIQEKPYYKINDDELNWSRNVVNRLNAVTQENRTSEQFKAVQAAAERYRSFCEQNKGEILSEDVYNIRRKHLVAISKAAKAYTDYKKRAIFKNDYTKSRIAAVNSILNESTPKSMEDFYGDMKKSMSREDYRRYADGLHAYADRALDAFNARMRKEARSIENNSKMNQMSNDELVDMIFSSNKPAQNSVSQGTPKKQTGMHI